MIINLLLNTLVLILGAIFSWLPTVTKLPTIGGFDIDTALSTGMGEFHTFVNSFWLFRDIFVGFIFLMGYYIIKIVVTLFLGHRAPGGK